MASPVAVLRRVRMIIEGLVNLQLTLFSDFE
jgi:hypothetical protein